MYNRSLETVAGQAKRKHNAQLHVLGIALLVLDKQ